MIYTNDDKGSYDPEMTSERLARIRMHEEEEACRIIGIPKENISWLEYHDGMLEYANTRDLVEEVTGIIRKVRPDVVLSIDPGTEYVRWHKTDHRMAANNTVDAIRAAEWHLYFPNQLLHEGLQPFLVPQEFYYYVTDKDANYWVNIDSVVEKKLDAAMAHVSQWEPSIHHYRPDWDSGRSGEDQGRIARPHSEKRRALCRGVPHHHGIQSGMKAAGLRGSTRAVDLGARWCCAAANFRHPLDALTAEEYWAGLRDHEGFRQAGCRQPLRRSQPA